MGHKPGWYTSGIGGHHGLSLLSFLFSRTEVGLVLLSIEYLLHSRTANLSVKNSPEASEMSQVCHQEVRITNPSSYVCPRKCGFRLDFFFKVYFTFTYLLREVK